MRGTQRVTVPVSDSNLDVPVRKGYLAPEERGRHDAIKQALEAFLSDSAHAHALSRRTSKNINRSLGWQRSIVNVSYEANCRRRTLCRTLLPHLALRPHK
jgi:hypothetical protein